MFLFFFPAFSLHSQICFRQNEYSSRKDTFMAQVKADICNLLHSLQNHKDFALRRLSSYDLSGPTLILRKSNSDFSKVPASTSRFHLISSFNVANYFYISYIINYVFHCQPKTCIFLHSFFLLYQSRSPQFASLSTKFPGIQLQAGRYDPDAVFYRCSLILYYFRNKINLIQKQKEKSSTFGTFPSHFFFQLSDDIVKQTLTTASRPVFRNLTVNFH